MARSIYYFYKFRRVLKPSLPVSSPNLHIFVYLYHTEPSKKHFNSNLSTLISSAVAFAMYPHIVWTCFLLPSIVNCWPDVFVAVPGDVILGGLFAVHGAPSGDGGGCGPVREHYGIQRVEAALLALREINSGRLLPGVRLGAELRDSCWVPHTALRQTMILVRGEHAASCGNQRAGAPLLGVLGPGASAAAAQVQNLLQLFSIPQVSYSATSRELSDRARFSTFHRVVPSDLHQSRALVALLRAHNWTYVFAIHTDESYGQSGMAAFREVAAAAGVCVARDEPLRAAPGAREVDAALSRLRAAANVDVALCWCEGRTARAVLAGVARSEARGERRLRWLASDGWADRGDVVAGLEVAAEGALTLRVRSPYLRNFDEHYKGLRPYNNSRNPWFKEFWEQKFNCTLRRGTTDMPRCSGNESLADGYSQEPKLGLVVRAVYAMAHALRDMRAALCPTTRRGLCPAILPFNVTLFKGYLSRVRFRAPDGGLVAFDENGDPPAELSEYDVMSFERNGGTWGYSRAGWWRRGELRLRSQVAVRRRAASARAVCSPPCPAGHYKEAAGEAAASCCWACVPCPPLSIPRAKGGCSQCPPGSRPDISRSRCLPSPVEWGGARERDRRAVAAAALAGLASAALSAAALWRHRNTPAVKAASRELCALQLCAGAACQAAAMGAAARPGLAACWTARLAAPGLAGAYAAVLARTVRVARLVAAARRGGGARARLLSSRAQLALWTGLITPGTGAAIWAALEWPPTPRLEHPGRARSVLVCGGSHAAALLWPLAPALALLVLCAILAWRTRKLPHNFNEARFIGAAVYSTCLVWVALVPVVALTEAKTLALCGGASLCASACVCLCVWPRVWVCVCRPERNTRAHFLTAPRSLRCHAGRYVPPKTSKDPANGSCKDVGCQTERTQARVTELLTEGDTRHILITLPPPL